MATPHIEDQRDNRKLALLEIERKTDADARQTVWVFLWSLFGIKIGTVAVIWYAAGGSAEAQVLVYATTWFWLIIPAAALAGPFLYWRRMIRQRRRRDELRHAEWHVEDPPVVVVDDHPRFT